MVYGSPRANPGCGAAPAHWGHKMKSNLIDATVEKFNDTDIYGSASTQAQLDLFERVAIGSKNHASYVDYYDKAGDAGSIAVYDDAQQVLGVHLGGDMIVLGKGQHSTYTESWGEDYSSWSDLASSSRANIEVSPYLGMTKTDALLDFKSRESFGYQNSDGSWGTGKVTQTIEVEFTSLQPDALAKSFTHNVLDVLDFTGKSYGDAGGMIGLVMAPQGVLADPYGGKG